jgi:uncharacterized protein (DUF1778 family)
LYVAVHFKVFVKTSSSFVDIPAISQIYLIQYHQSLNPMANPLPATAARIEARVSVEAKALIQKAVDIEGGTLTDFISKSAQVAAQNVIESHQTLKLGIEDSKAFVDAILNPKEPNEALKKAMRRHKQELGNVS